MEEYLFSFIWGTQRMPDRAARGGGIATSIDESIWARVKTGVKYAVTGSTGWFGPQNPLPPVAQEQAAGRLFDYPTGYNQRISPRTEESVSFAQMRALSDNYDLLRIIIETVKDQLDTQEWIIKPRDSKAKPDARCDEIRDFLQFPDKEHDHATWLRMLLEDMLVIDAASIYPRRTKGGQLYSLEVIDGSTIKRLINGDGRTPLPPDPAYQQILKGLPAVDYSRDELVYLPRNVRSSRIYGYSPVEQIIMTVNIALRRQLHQLEYYTEGNTPDLIFRVPEQWQPDQIKQMQLWWDFLITDTASRRKAKFIPGGVDPYDTKQAALKDEYDEWLARIVCYCFGVAPQPFVKEVNRATAETSAEASKEEGKGPRMLWVKRMHDLIIWKYFGYADLEFGWEDQTDVNPLVQAQIDQIYLSTYVISPEEVRSRIGMEGPAPEKPMPPMIGDENADDDTDNAGSGGDSGGGDVVTPADKPVDTKQKKVEQAASPELTRRKKKVLSTIDRNRSAVMKARRKLGKLFNKFLADVKPGIIQTVLDVYASEVRMAPVEDDVVEKAVREINFDGWAVLIEPTAAILEAVTRDGQAVALAQIGVEANVSTDLMNDLAVQYAEARAADLVGMRNIGSKEMPEWVVNPDAEWPITESTRRMIRSDVEKAMAEGWSNDRLADALEESNAFSESRAEMIARTETAFADVEGNMQAYRESGVVEGKEWILGSEHDDDDDCNTNAEAGVIGLDDTFPSGDDAPPNHPNCVCDVLPVVIEEEQTDEH